MAGIALGGGFRLCSRSRLWLRLWSGGWYWWCHSLGFGTRAIFLEKRTRGRVYLREDSWSVDLRTFSEGGHDGREG